MKKKVVVTGLGMLSPLGNSLEESWAAVCQGHSGIAKITKFDTEAFSVKIAGEVKNFDPLPYVSKSEARRFDNFILYAAAAAQMALADAGLSSSTNINPERFGVVIGSAIGGIATIEHAHKTLLEVGANKISPFTVPCSLANMASGFVSIQAQAKGVIGSTVTACAASGQAIENALHLIESGRADAVIAGGTEAAVTALAVAGFHAMRVLSTQNENPNCASRPFDKNRDGFVIGEGAGIVILEEAEHAHKRGAKIYAQLVGAASTSDAFHIAAPPEGHGGAARCMRAAIRDAGLRPEDIDYINAHGTATQLNDLHEAQAIRAVFGAHASSLLISSTKSMTGHMLGASGGVEAAFAIKSICDSIVPPTTNFETPDDVGQGLDFVPTVARKKNITSAMSCSFGFGGVNVTLIFKKFVE